MQRKFAATTVLIGIIAIAGSLEAKRAVAHEPDTSMHRVSFSVERSRQVENDWVRAVVGITDEDPDSALVAERVNKVMDWALGEAKKQKLVRVKSGAYRTYPISEGGRIRRWQASQEIVIEGSDVVPVGELVAKLQARLQLRSLTFSVTPERRRQVEDDLSAEALAACRNRAELVRTSLEASSYEIVSISIGGSGSGPQRRFQEARMMMAKSSAKRAVPALEAGTTLIQVNANGTVEFD